MMRNWFILFTTTFTITSFILMLTTWIVPYLPTFYSSQIIFMFISSALLSLSLVLLNQLAMDNIVLSIFIDVIIIFIIVFGTGVLMKIVPVALLNAAIVLILIILIYSVITLIYMSILKKEAVDMNEKIARWRNKYVKGK